MIWFAKRDRSLDAFAEAIRPELNALRAPRASSALRDRIIADRAAGVRVILPTGSGARRTMPRYLVAAALVIAALLAFPFYRDSRDVALDDQPATLLSYFGSVARAQEPAPSVPALPPAFPVHAERVHAGTLEYSRVWNDSSGRVVKRANGVLSVSADSVSGTPAWRVVENATRDSSAIESITAETLFVARNDLRLLARAVHMRPYRRWNGINIQQRIIGDSVSGRMTLDDVKGRRLIERRLSRAYAPYLADVFAPVYLSALPLNRRWQGSVTLLGWAVVPNDVRLPVELRVTGEETISVPAGRFDCWKLDVSYSGGRFDYWVRKSDGIGVRADERLPDGGHRVVTLVR